MLYIVSVDYDTLLGCIVLRLYNTETCAIEYHYDTSFLPYFYSKEKQKIDGVVKQEQVELYDALHDEKIIVWKVTVKNPLVITYNQKKFFNVWENHIKTFMSFIYDNDVKMGMPYIREKGVLFLNIDKDAEERVKELTKLVSPAEYNKIICEELARLLEYPAPNFKRTSLDIEVLNDISPLKERYQKLSNQTKRFIYLLCYYTLVKECDVQRQEEKLEKLMKNIDREIEITKGNTKKPIENNVTSGQENHIEKKDKTQLEEAKQSYVQTIGIRIIKNICENILKDGYKEENVNSLKLKVENVSDAETLMNELLKSIILKKEDSQNELSEQFMKLSEEWIGKNYNSFVPIAIELFTLSEENLRQNNKVPSPSSANLPIICIGMVSNTGEKTAFVLLQEDKEFSCPEADVVYWFSSEKELLEAVFEFAKQYPFIVTFNGDDFDLPYLLNRSFRLGIALDKIPITLDVKGKIGYWKGAIHIDLYKFFSIKSMQTYAFQGKYKTIDLDTISFVLLGEGKLKGEHSWVGDMTYEELVKYCLKDGDLTIRLTTYNDNLVMNLILVLARLSYMPIELSSRKPISQWIRSMIYYEHRKRGIIIPRSEDIIAMKGQTTTTALIKGKKYKGAIVVPPVAGFHFNTKVGDFASLYPSIIKNWNLGYATVNCPHEECRSNRFADMPHWICTKNRAIESQLIGTLKDLRVKWYKQKAKEKNNPQKPWYSVSEQSIKVICNAAYGVFGDEDFVLYCPPMPEYVTGIGRWIITETIKHGQELGLNVIYGDTDSIFIKNPAKEVLEELLKWAKAQFDIDFELDKSYRYICLSTRKKNYLGVLEDGFVDVKGMTGKKKHTPKIIKNPFEGTKKLLSEIYTEVDIPEKKAAILKLVKTTYTKLKTRSFDNMEDLAFHVTASKNLEDYEGDPQHIKAAKALRAAGDDVGEGSDISFVKITAKPKVKPTKLAKAEEIDVSKYIEFLQSTFIQILEPLGIDWDKDILGVCVLDKFC